MTKLKLRRRPFNSLWLSAAWLWGCSHGPASGGSRQLHRTQAAVAAAQAAHAAAGSLPGLHLQLAQDALKEGLRIHAASEAFPPRAATAALARAEMDARLALALVQETAARAREEELRDRLTDLEHHLQISGLAIDTDFGGEE